VVVLVVLMVGVVVVVVKNRECVNVVPVALPTTKALAEDLTKREA
jgi:hypothetical protein